MVIALTGKCCSGKNYISDIFSRNGFTIIDVDNISRDVFDDSSDKILELFGTTDRSKIGSIIFSNPKFRELLEAIIHPEVYRRINITIDNPGKYIINIPLLTDIELIDRCKGIIWIKSPLLLRVIRSVKRDSYNLYTIIKRIHVQRKLSVKHLKGSVDIYYIRNSWFSMVLKRDVKNILTKLERG